MEGVLPFASNAPCTRQACGYAPKLSDQNSPSTEPREPPARRADCWRRACAVRRAAGQEVSRGGVSGYKGGSVALRAALGGRRATCEELRQIVVSATSGRTQRRHTSTRHVGSYDTPCHSPDRLKGHAWIGAEDGSMLDVVGAELLLVGAGSGNETGALCACTGVLPCRNWPCYRDGHITTRSAHTCLPSCSRAARRAGCGAAGDLQRGGRRHCAAEGARRD